jgi:hypothetical protein
MPCWAAALSILPKEPGRVAVPVTISERSWRIIGSWQKRGPLGTDDGRGGSEPRVVVMYAAAVLEG